MNTRALLTGAVLGALVSFVAAPRRRRGRSRLPVKGALLGAVAALVAPKLGVNLPMLGAGSR